MAKMWAGRTDGQTSRLADEFNSSLAVDSRMYRQDIRGSMAHALMLGATQIISEAEAQTIIDGLQGILDDLESGRLSFDPSCEDVHMFVEQVLTQRIGAAGKKLHTARSRNDQVALDVRLYLREKIDGLQELLTALVTSLTDTAEKYRATILPGYTHLQRAQPITFGHHLLAYVMMLLRDKDRLRDCRRRMNVSPIGSCALAGTTYPTDRRLEAEKLGFDDICRNSIDGVSDRDFCVELVSDLATVMMHLSRLAEEVVLWSSWEFHFVELSDAFTTGSSIMPQKKNSDMAELVRGKTGRVYGDLIALLTLLKGLPLAYNKDMQEDKESVFDAVDTVEQCLKIFDGMISTMTVHPERMREAAGTGFINATDLADYLTRKGVPFRDAYRVAGQVVAYGIRTGKTLEQLSLEEYRQFHGQIDEDVYHDIDLSVCVEKRLSEGGTSTASVDAQIAWVRRALAEN